MKYFIYFVLLCALCAGCKKNCHSSNDKVDIYILKSFSVGVDQTGVYPRQFVSNAVLEDKPLVSNADIQYYQASSATFALTKNIKATIKDFTPSQGFAITVNSLPVYYGVFHPGYMSSIAFGIATIDPIISTTETSLSVKYVGFNNDAYWLSFDKRNDAAIIDAFRNSGRLR